MRVDGAVSWLAGISYRRGARSARDRHGADRATKKSRDRAVKKHRTPTMGTRKGDCCSQSGQLPSAPRRNAGAWRILPALALTLAIAACGSSGHSGTGSGTGRYSSFLNFSKCMRSHGVSNFPDPSPSGGGIHIGGPGVNPQSPAFQSAFVVCKKQLPGGGPPAQVPESQKLQALKSAECMRAHGVPNYPDPTFPKGGGILQGGPGSGINPNSPAFQRAARSCGGP